VMSVELYDEDGGRLEPAEEPLWRGVVLQSYANGRWSRPDSELEEVGEALAKAYLPTRYIRQDIKLEPTSSEVLFALRPIVRASVPQPRAYGSTRVFSKNPGALVRADLRAPIPLQRMRPRLSAYDYQVVSRLDIDQPQ